MLSRTQVTTAGVFAGTAIYTVMVPARVTFELFPLWGTRNYFSAMLLGYLLWAALALPPFLIAGMLAQRGRLQPSTAALAVLAGMAAPYVVSLAWNIYVIKAWQTTVSSYSNWTEGYQWPADLLAVIAGCAAIYAMAGTGGSRQVLATSNKGIEQSATS